MKLGEVARIDCTPDYAYGAGEGVCMCPVLAPQPVTLLSLVTSPAPGCVGMTLHASPTFPT